MDKLKKGWEWLVKSSADANKWSLTVKSVLYGLIPTAIYFLGLANIQVGSEALTEAVNLTAQLIVLVGGVVTAVSAVLGLVRKIGTTITGDNDVVLGWSDEY